MGHKAAGFISKKFFHPSNFKNQEKLWAAIEEKKEQEKRQDELLKKREEERRVEALMTEMKSQTGTVRSSAIRRDDSLVEHPVDSVSRVEKEAMIETRKRLALLRESNQETQELLKISVRSRYPEDVHEGGHTEVWGSYFNLDVKKWGYACCQSLDRSVDCPLATSSPRRKKHGHS